MKNDIADATMLADLLRMGRLPEAWVAPPAVRELREEVRYRHKLTRLQTGLKAQVHQVLGKEGVIPETKGIWWSGGQRWLDELQLGDVYTNRIESLRDLIELLRPRDPPVRHPHPHAASRAIPATRRSSSIAGVGRVLAAVFVAEIGDVHRFRDARQLCSWAGLTPRLRESDTHTHRGHITKQGSRLLRWAAIEAVSGAARDRRAAAVKARVGARRGRQHRPRRGGPTSPHARLLRAARRPHPLSRRPPTRREVGHDQTQLVVSA